MAISWSARTLPAAQTWQAAAWNGSVFCMVGFLSATAATSPDGTTWTSRTISSRRWTALAWNGTVFCAIGTTSTGSVSTSPDGITWTERTLPNAQYYQSLAWNGTVFCAVSDGNGAGSTVGATSPDGVTWTERTLPSASIWQSVAWDGTVFCAVGKNSANAATSPDGITWTARTLPASRDWRSIVSNGAGTLIAFAYNTAICAVSTDHGVSWTEYALPASTFWMAATWNGSKFVVVSYFGTAAAESADGTSWTATTLPSNTGWRAIASDGAGMVVVGSDDTSTSALQGVDGTINESVSDTFASTLSGNADVWPTLVDALTATGTPDPEVLANLIERLVAGGSLSLSTTLAGTVVDAVTFTEQMLTAWHLLLAEEIATAGEASANTQKLVALLDALVASGRVDGPMTAFAACTAAIAMEGLIQQGFSANAIDEVVLAAATTAVATMLAPLVDAFTGSDTAGPLLRVSAVTADAVTVSDDLASLLTAQVDMADGVLLYATLRIGSTDYVGWVLNTVLKAPSEYTNAAWDSLAEFQGMHFAAGPDGLVQFTGATDDGAAIPLTIRSFLTDFGTGKWKRVPDALLGVTDAGDVVLKVITRHPGTGAQEEDWYRAERAPTAGPGNARVQIGRGLKSTWWGYSLVNVDGASLELNGVQWRPVVLDRRT